MKYNRKILLRNEKVGGEVDGVVFIQILKNASKKEAKES